MLQWEVVGVEFLVMSLLIGLALKVGTKFISIPQNGARDANELKRRRDRVFVAGATASFLVVAVITVSVL